MSTRKKYNLISPGDYVTEQEAKATTESDIRHRCENVTEVVKKKILPIDKALKMYNVSLHEYLGYHLIENKSVEVSGIIMALMTREFLNIVILADPGNDSKSKRIVDELREFTSVE